MTKYLYRNVLRKDLPIILKWLDLPYIKKWIHSDGLKNTLDGLERCISGVEKINRYWIASSKGEDFAFLIAGIVNDLSHDDFKSINFAGSIVVSLDIFIGNPEFLGKGLASSLISEFLLTKFPNATDFIIDPEKSNKRAIHVYEKVGFSLASEFTAYWNPVPHLMMHVKKEEVVSR